MSPRFKQFTDNVLANLVSWIIIALLCAGGGVLIGLLVSVTHSLSTKDQAILIALFGCVVIALVVSIYWNIKQPRKTINPKSSSPEPMPSIEETLYLNKIRNDFTSLTQPQKEALKKIAHTPGISEFELCRWLQDQQYREVPDIIKPLLGSSLVEQNGEARIELKGSKIAAIAALLKRL